MLFFVAVIVVTFLGITNAQTATLIPSSSLVPVLDGETYIPKVGYGQYSLGTGVLGGSSFFLNPSPWHAPVITLSAPLWRSAFDLYSSIEMYILCPVTPAPLTLKFQRWTSTGAGGNSNTISLAPYADVSTPITEFGNTWTRVEVPMSVFKAPDWDLRGVENIYFNSDTKSRRCHVDNIALKKTVVTVAPTLAPSAVPTTAPSTTMPTRSAAIIDTINLVSSLGVDPIFDGESFSSSDVRYAAIVPGTGLQNSVGLELRPDTWHAPAYLLSSPLYRNDIGRYAEVILYARCEQEETPLTMHFGRWTSTGVGSTSAKALLGNFADPLDLPMKNTIGTTWTKIRVPISTFVTADWSLAGAENIYFNSDTKNRRCWVDNMYVWTTKVPTAVPTAPPTLTPTPEPSTASPTRVIPEDMQPALVRKLGVEPVFDGEPNSFTSTDIRYGAVVPGTGVQGSVGWELQPDRWHSPAFLLSAPLYRSDLMQYNELLMYARCAVDTPLSIHFGRWTPNGIGGASASVFVANYAEPRDSPVKDTIGTVWTKIRIPLTAFVTPEWSLSGPEWIYFNSDTLNRKCWIDNMYVRENVGPIVLQAERISDSILRVETNKYYDLDSARIATNYVLSDPTTGTQVAPASIGLHYKFENFKDYTGSTYIPRSRYYINLIFATPLDAGKVYSLRMANVTDPAANPMNTTVLPIDTSTLILSKSIKVNQLGYLPDRLKKAYVSDFLGDNDGGVWAVGAAGSIWQWTRASGAFAKVPVSLLPVEVRSRNLRGVFANAPNDVWVVGDAGTILHFDGTSWMLVASPTDQNLYAVDFGPSGTTAFIVGDNGVILRFQPAVGVNLGRSEGTWVRDTSSPTTKNLRAVWVGTTVAWAGGAEGTILKLIPTGSSPSWSQTTQLTNNQTIIAIEGIRTSNADYAICDGGLKLRNQWGSWIVEAQLDMPLNDYVVNPTKTKFGLGVGPEGVGYTARGTTNGVFSTGTSSTLNTITMVEEQTAFAFGDDGVCVEGSTADAISAWTACSLPEPTHVYGSASLLEGPLRLSYPLPQATLQRLDTTTNEWVNVGVFDLVLRAMNYHLSGEDVYIIDFSTATGHGTHRFYIPGLGVSYSFAIAPSVYETAAYHTCRMLYYQRSGTALETPFAESRFSRGIDHEYDLSTNGRRIDGAYHWSIAESPLYDNEVICPLKSASCPEGSMADGAGGWFDAGDYSKYVATGTPGVWRLLTTVDILQQRQLVNSDSLNLPESGDGVPDLLNEATWEIRWLMKMQKSDGGVFNKLASEIWESGPPETSDLGGQRVRFFLPRTTHDTATTGAVFASASRHWAAYDPVFAAELMRRALLAWSFLSTYPTAVPANGFRNPAGHISGPYYDTDDTDNRAWLAAELYRTTCDASYGAAYVQFIVNNNNVVGMGGNDFVDYRLEAAWAFYHASTCGNESTLFVQTRALVRNALVNSANGNKGRVLGNVYQNVGRLDVPEWIGWGSTTLTWAHFMSVLAFHITSDTDHLDWLTLSLDTVLGANALATSFVTGLGHKYPMDPLQGQSRSDNVAEPIPGYVVMGPYAHVSMMSPNFAVAQGDRSNYPSMLQDTSPYPILRRWADSNLLPQYNEGGVTPAAWQCGAFQLLHSFSTRAVGTQQQ